METEKPINEIELQRLMADQATRAEYCAQLHKRHSAMQTLMSKIQTLSDSEFETAYGTLESLILNYNTKKAKFTKKPDDNASAHELGIATRRQ